MQQQQHLQSVQAGPADDAANFKKRGIPTLKAGQRIEFGTRPGDGKQFRFRESPYGRSPTNHVFKLRLPKSTPGSRPAPAAEGAGLTLLPALPQRRSVAKCV